MKRILLVVVLLFLLVTPFVLAGDVDLFFFHRTGCPVCATMDEFLVQLEDSYPELNVTRYEVRFNKENSQLFLAMADAYDHEITGVPTIFIDEKVVAGLSSSLLGSLEAEVVRCISEGCESPITKLKGKVSEEKTEITGRTDPVVLFESRAVRVVAELFFVGLVIAGLWFVLKKKKK